MENKDKEKIFCLGDSRTGTRSLHFYFQKNGRRSVHYYVADAGATIPLHEDSVTNCTVTLRFVRDSGYDAFADYPTRSFWRELARDYPDAYYILTTRKDTSVWVRSAKEFFGKFNSVIDYEELSYFHDDENKNIREFFAGAKLKFLEICIDDGNEENSKKLAAFLGFDKSILLSRENASEDSAMEEISQRTSIWGNSPLTLSQVSSQIHEGKAMLSEFGWLFLARDTNDFLPYQFGESTWSDEDFGAVAAIMNQRISRIDALGIKYLKFIIPEKSVVYREFLPSALNAYKTSDQRPARIIQDKFSRHVFYLDKYLNDAKSYGNLYFRGDTHPNWMGAYFIYRYIAERLNMWNISITEPIEFKDLIPSIGSYDGDLYAQLEEKQKRILKLEWGFLLAANAFELVIKLDVPPHVNRAVRVNSRDDQLYKFSDRETFVYETKDSELPKAVIFRDSVFDFVHPLLAQHFSRSVFVWHEGAVIADIIEQERPDVIIHGMAERFVSAYPRFEPISRLGLVKPHAEL